MLAVTLLSVSVRIRAPAPAMNLFSSLIGNKARYGPPVVMGEEDLMSPKVRSQGRELAQWSSPARWSALPKTTPIPPPRGLSPKTAAVSARAGARHVRGARAEGPALVVRWRACRPDLQLQPALRRELGLLGALHHFPQRRGHAAGDSSIRSGAQTTWPTQNKAGSHGVQSAALISAPKPTASKLARKRTIRMERCNPIRAHPHSVTRRYRI